MKMLRTKIGYLARDDLYCSEKPYAASFTVNAKRSNIITAEHDADVSPITHQDRFSIDINGFCILKETTSLTLNDALEGSDRIEKQYHAELENILHRHFPQYTRFESLDFVVRVRHPRLDSDEVVALTHEQPVTTAHVDYTPEGSIVQLKESFPGQEEHFLDKDYDLINVWKPLIGPNNDWPLALCDFTTVELSDIVPADVLHADRVNENQLLHSSDKHRWYYVDSQQPQDLIVFRNSDRTGKRAVGFHVAVPNPKSTGPPRASVEVRFVAFR